MNWFLSILLIAGIVFLIAQFFKMEKDYDIIYLTKKKTMKQIWNEYKVFIIGALMSALLALNELVKEGEVSFKVLGFAAATALLSWVAKNLRGQIASIAGILGTTIGMYLTMEQQGMVNWTQLIILFLIQVLSVVAPPAKPLSYEK